MKLRNFRTFKIITFGCRVNQAESRALGAEIVKLSRFHRGSSALPPGLNCHIVDNYKEADLVVINTCCVTHKAEKEVRKEIRRAKRENPKCFLVVTGCWTEGVLRAGINLTRFSQNKLRPDFRTAGRNRSNLAINASAPANVRKYSRICSFERELLSLFDLTDLLIGNKDKKKIGQILQNQFANLAIGQFKNKQKYQDKYAQSKKALVKIQEGCDNFCSYCIVPYVRGRSQSRPIKEIVEEIKDLVVQEIEEAILTGTDISDYKFGLVKLIKVILEKTEIKKISFGSINLKSFDEEFIDFYSEQIRFSPNKLRLSTHFHIPLQSGCNETLKRMNRKYTAENFKGQISKLKSKIPNFSFSTDVIVGFPGESKKEFEQTLKTLKKIKKIMGKSFTKIHVFRYSARQSTMAVKMTGKIGWEKVGVTEKKSRSRKINCLFNG